MNPSFLGRQRCFFCLAAVLIGCDAGILEESNPPATKPDDSAKPTAAGGQKSMQIYYLEIVTKDVDAVCAGYAATNNVRFSAPDAALGNARTIPMPGGGLLGVRAPLRDTEKPVVRPYRLVDDIEAAVAAATKAGATIALPPMKLPGHGTCAIYLQGGVEHGLWQK
jgi:predicted enzyme related to lactoylglutathione lyase